MREPGLCWCGCGASVTSSTARYLVGHHRRKSPVDYIIDEVTGCWVWQRATGGRTPETQYAVTWHNGRQASAYRVTYEQQVGPIPEGMQLDHLCRNPRCVNPAHLEPVTNAENGRRGNSTRLTPADVREIRSNSMTSSEAAAHFGVGERHIHKIRKGETWSDVA